MAVARVRLGVWLWAVLRGAECCGIGLACVCQAMIVHAYDGSRIGCALLSDGVDATLAATAFAVARDAGEDRAVRELVPALRLELAHRKQERRLAACACVSPTSPALLAA